MEIKDKELFLKYAFPCIGTLVNRGKVTKERAEYSFLALKNGKIPKDIENVFQTARAMCEFIAKRQGKNVIDSEVIRQYFIFEHNSVVDERYNLMKDFDPIKCKIYPGKVKSIEKEKALVETPIGKEFYKADFVPDIKVDDCVIVHWDYIVEKIPLELAKKLWKK